MGSALVGALRQQGRTVLAPARGRETELEGLEVGDLFYCAGLTADYARDPSATVEAHLGLLARLLDRLQPRRVVYLSSTRLFDSQPGAVVSDTSGLWLNPSNPRHLYDLTKAAGESLCLAMAGDRVRIARLSCVWSLEAHAPGFLPTLLRHLLALPSDPEQRSTTLTTHPKLARHYIHREDLVAALIAMAQADQHPLITSLACAPEATSNGELAACLETALQCQIRFAASTADSEPPAAAPRLDLSHLGQLPIPAPRPLCTHLQQLLACSSRP